MMLGWMRRTKETKQNKTEKGKEKRRAFLCLFCLAQIRSKRTLVQPVFCAFYFRHNHSRVLVRSWSVDPLLPHIHMSSTHVCICIFTIRSILLLHSCSLQSQQTTAISKMTGPKKIALFLIMIALVSPYWSPCDLLMFVTFIFVVRYLIDQSL